MRGEHAASDYLEDARAGRRARRSAAGAWAAAWPASPRSRTCRRARRWPPRSTRRDPVRGLGRLHPARWRWTGPCAWSGRARPSRSPSTGCCARDLVLAAAGAPDAAAGGAPLRAAPRAGSSRCRRAPAWRSSPPGRRRCDGVDPLVTSTNLARRGRARRRTSTAPWPQGCDVYLTELKAAAIDTVARRARAEGARVVFLRNRPVGQARRRAAGGVPTMPAETIVFHKGHGLPYSKGLMAQSLSATGLSPERAFELARAVERRLAERGATEVDVEGCTPSARRCCWSGGGRRARAPLPRLEPARAARAAARGADRRHHRRRQVHARDDAGRPARDQPRDRHRRDPPGAAGVLHPGGDAHGAPLGVRRGRNRGLRATRPNTWPPAPRRSWSGRRTRRSRWCSRESTWCPGRSTRRMRERCVLVEALLVVEDASSTAATSRTARAPGPPSATWRLRRDPPAPGPPGRARPGGGRGGDRQHERGRGAGAPDAARAGRGGGRPAELRPAAASRVPRRRARPPAQRTRGEPARRSPRNRVGARRRGLPRQAQGRPGGRDPAPPGRRSPRPAGRGRRAATRSPEDEALEAPRGRGRGRGGSRRGRRGHSEERQDTPRELVGPRGHEDPRTSRDAEEEPRGAPRRRPREEHRDRRARHARQRQRLPARRPGGPIARRRLRLARPDPPLRAALRRRGQRAGAPAAPQRAPSLARARRDRERRRRRAARRAALVRRPHARLPDEQAARAGLVGEHFLRARLARGDRGPPGAGASTLLREIGPRAREGP